MLPHRHLFCFAQVLDLSSWMARHPGGKKAILAVAGLDATDEIIAMHNDHIVEKLVPLYVIGRVRTNWFNFSVV